jgi:WD repeat-containing protein 76
MFEVLQIYSCSCEGEICLMDVEKETFDMIQICDYPIISLCQAPNNPICLYFGEGNGESKLFDERLGKVPTTWNAHDNRINSIDFHPENPYMFATSSADRTACLWDLRRMKKEASESLKVFEHSKTVQSAYFSPSCCMVATTRCYIFILTRHLLFFSCLLWL